MTISPSSFAVNSSFQLLEIYQCFPFTFCHNRPIHYPTNASVFSFSPTAIRLHRFFRRLFSQHPFPRGRRIPFSHCWKHEEWRYTGVQRWRRGWIWIQLRRGESHKYGGSRAKWQCWVIKDGRKRGRKWKSTANREWRRSDRQWAREFDCFDREFYVAAIPQADNPAHLFLVEFLGLCNGRTSAQHLGGTSGEHMKGM